MGEIWGSILCKKWGVRCSLCNILYWLSLSLLHVNNFLADSKASDNISASNSTPMSFSHNSLFPFAFTQLAEKSFWLKNEIIFLLFKAAELKLWGKLSIWLIWLLGVWNLILQNASPEEKCVCEVFCI